MNLIATVLVVCCLLICDNIQTAHGTTCWQCTDCPEVDVSVTNVPTCTGSICYIKLVEGHIDRGCDEIGFCQPTDSFCKECSFLGCNGDPIKSLQCMTDGGQSKQCLPGQQCFYYEKEQTKRMGCWDVAQNADIEEECNSTDSPFCEKCNDADNCNNRLECYKCDETIESCTTLQNLQDLQKETCSRSQKQCFVKNNDNNLNIRGCNTEEDCENDQNKCCEKALCNIDKFPTTRRECLIDENKSTKVCKNPDDSCFTKYTDGNVQRGCMTDLGANQCTDGKICSSCTEDKCNKNIICKNCDKLDAINCTSVLCEDKCYAAIGVSGNVERRCAKQEDTCDGKPGFCELCSENDCNNKSPDWLKCHVCDGKDCAKTQNDTDAKYCAKYKKNDQCYLKSTVNGTKRGCVSDPNSDCHSNNGCEKCDTSGCNSKANSSPSSGPIKCYQCDKTDPKCGEHLDSTLEPKECPNKMPDGQTEKCYTNKTDFSRGCLSDVQKDEKCAKGETCILCEKDGCNPGTTLQKYAVLIAASTILAIFTTHF